MRHQLCFVLVAVYAACGSSGTNSSSEPVNGDRGTVTTTASGGDPFVQLQRVPGSKFVEILEVRAFDDGRVLYCSGVKGLVILDARNPSAIKTVHRLRSKLSHPRFPRCQHLAVSGKYIYATNRGDEIQTKPFVAAFDLSGAPKEVATFTAKGVSIEGIATSGKYVFVTVHDKGLLVLEHDNESLKQVGSLGGFTNAWAVVVAQGSTLYVADGKAGLVVVDVSTPNRPKITGRAKFPGNSQSLAFDAKSKIAWVAAGSGGVVAVDVRDATKPKVVGTYDSPGSALQVALANGYAFVADWNDVRILDIKDPTKPRVVASERIKTGGSYPRVLGIGASGSHAYIGEWTGLYVYKFNPAITAPDLWVETGRLDFGSVKNGAKANNAVIIENHGTKTLRVSSIEVKGSSAFTVSVKHSTLEPGGAALLGVTFTATASGEAKATLVLRSDDPDEPTRQVLLSANKAGKGVGQMAPEVLGKLIAGGDFKLSSLRGKVVVLAYFSTF